MTVDLRENAETPGPRAACGFSKRSLRYEHAKSLMMCSGNDHRLESRRVGFLTAGPIAQSLVTSFVSAGFVEGLEGFSRTRDEATGNLIAPA